MKDENHFRTMEKDLQLRSNIHLECVIKMEGLAFPINHLRNIAVDHVKTSHFYLSDMDIWPSRTSTLSV